MSRPNLARKLSIIAIGCLAIIGSPLFGQTASTQVSPASGAKDANTEPLAFDAVSIKENKSGDRNGNAGYRYNGLYMVNMSLTMFLYRGFHPAEVYGAPDWLLSDRYDFEAKVAESDLAAYHKASSAERDRMLLAVFEERMKLKTHKETRELPIFALVPAKNGSKLKETEEGSPKHDLPPNDINLGGGLYWVRGLPAGEAQLIGQGASIKRLAQYLSYMTGIDRLTVDKTGLIGEYDFTLDWADPKYPDATAPSIYTAIQEQLGLKLEPTKGSVEVLVIDHIERPTEN